MKSSSAIEILSSIPYFARLDSHTLESVAQAALRRVLYGLYALVKVHFAKEEEVYLPLLDARLAEGEAHAMFEAMEAVAKEAKGVHVH